MGTPVKRTPPLSVTRNSDVRFSVKNSKSLLKMLIAHTYHLYDIGALTFKLISNCPDFNGVIIF